MIPQSPSAAPLLELRSGRCLTRETMPVALRSASATTMPPPQCFATTRQRDPPKCAGLRGNDVEEWLDNCPRVSAYNRWEDSLKLLNAGFSLSEVAKTWYLNHEKSIPNWKTFTSEFRKIFGTSTNRSEGAKRKLEARAQHPCESYTSYIEDVLALCRRVNMDMSESDHVYATYREVSASSLLLCPLFRALKPSRMGLLHVKF